MLALFHIGTFAGVRLLFAIGKFDFHAACILELDAVDIGRAGSEVRNTKAGAGIVNFDIVQVSRSGVDYAYLDELRTATNR